MKKTTAFAILYLFAHSLFAQTGFITFRAPRANQLEPSLLQLDFVVAGFAFTTVTASVSGRPASIANIGGRFEGTLSLAGLPPGHLTVQVVATDTLGNQLTGSQPFIYDPPPQLNIDSPLALSVARPLIHIKASCVDSGGCTLNVSENFGFAFTYPNFNFGNSVDTILDLSAYQGMSGNIVFTAMDGLGQTISQPQQVLVEQSPYLEQRYAARDQIGDFNYNKLLVSNPWWQSGSGTPDLNPYIFRSRVVNIITGDSTPIPYRGPLLVSLYSLSSQLTPYGAMLITQDTVTSIPATIDWNNDSLYVLTTKGGQLVHIAGNYTVWQADSLLYLRNLQTATNTLVTSSAYSTSDVTSDGQVVYGAEDHNIYRFANNVSRPLTNSVANKENANPLTDGKNVVYINYNACCTAQDFTLRLNNGHTDSLISDEGASAPDTYTDYQVNNGFVAYTKPDTAGIAQIWLRDSTGRNRQISFFRNNSRIELLNSIGDLTFTETIPSNASLRYFVRGSTGQVSRIGSALGQAFYRDSTWYLALGRMLYQVDVRRIPNAAANSVIQADSSVYVFKPSDFIQNFSGYAGLTNVIITSLPQKGVLKLNGIRVIANTPIPTDSLGYLTYTPNLGIGGTEDSLAWNGSNGTSYLPAPVTIVLNIGLLAPPQPQIAGLLPDYCSTAGIQKIKILNLPGSAAGIAATVTLDGDSLAIAADSSFSFAAGSLMPGTQILTILYSAVPGSLSAIGNSSLTDSFTIVQAGTPVVKASSNISTVLDMVNPIVITATNIRGGGTEPLYTFASDRQLNTILQAESSVNTLSIDPVTLAIGSNWIYTRMRSSATCISVPTALDSVQILRGQGTGIVIFPNPFDQFIHIDGLNTGKTYLITIYDAQGRRASEQQVSNSNSVTLNEGSLPTGVYWLSIYDYKKQKLIGTVAIHKIQ